jgi:predicted nucleotidyltransferase
MVALPDEIRDYLRYIVSAIKAAILVKEIYLFGSYANGTYREGKSDLDIYIVSPDKTKQRRELSLAVRQSFERKMQLPIEIVVNYEDDFEERSKMFMSLENEIITKGVAISAI